MIMNNLEKYKKDLEKLINKGNLLVISMEYECNPKGFEEAYGNEFEKLKNKIPSFTDDYQIWYSEAKSIIRQLLPDRITDFSHYYEKPKSRKDISYENYRINDYLQSLIVTRTQGSAKDTIVRMDAAIPQFKQQVAILKSVASRFDSSLFDIRQLVQADLFDSELASAKELIKYGFLRAAGAIAGVILEKHFVQVLDNHNIKTRKKHPTINDFNELLKNEGILDIPSWRQIQRLGDIRNLCDHNKDREPKRDEVEELVDGVEKFTKTLF